jgi:hypothetical protein
MAEDFIAVPGLGNVAFIRGGDILRDDEKRTKIATLCDGNVCDLKGNLVGRLEGLDVVETTPGSFRKLLEDDS